MTEERLMAHLKAAQEAGWWIIAVDAHGAQLFNGTDGSMIYAPVGEGIPKARGAGECVTVTRSAEACAILAERRNAAGLSIEELAELMGQTEAWLVRHENPRTKQAPGIEGFLAWAEVLGVEVYLRPAPMPQTTLRWISGTRNKQPSRERRFAIERSRDVARLAEKQAKG